MMILHSIRRQFIEYENVKELIFYVENEIGMEAEKVRVPVITQ